MTKKKVSYKSNEVKLNLVNLASTSADILFASGHTGKTERWDEIAGKLKVRYDMPFTGNGVRDWLKSFLNQFSLDKLQHLKETGITENDNGKLSDAHVLDRAVLDLLEKKQDIKDCQELAVQKKEKQGKMEEEMREAATKGMVKGSDFLNSDSSF